MRKTVNSIVCTGELIRSEFQEGDYDGKKFRQVAFIVRYAPNMELKFGSKYNEINGKGERSQMYDWVKEVFNKYKPFVSATLDKWEDGKPVWIETTNEKADKVTCKAELEIRDRAYRNRQTSELEIALNKFYKMNGKYGIVHATDDDVAEAKFSFEVFLKSVTKQKVNENEEILVVNGFGIKEGFGQYKSAVFPLMIKVPESGIEDTLEKLEDFEIKNGITVLFKGRVFNGKEKIQIGEELDGTPVLTSKTLDEFRLSQKVDKKNIYDFSEEHKSAIDPKDIGEMLKDRKEKLDKLKKDFEDKENGKTKNDTDNDVPFDKDELPDFLKD